MSRPRYVVQRVTGFPINLPMRHGTGSGGRSTPGVSAHVCDTVYLHEVVASYRSEHKRDGYAQAVRNADEHAERLNRDTA